MPRPSPGARARGLGAELRRIREERSLSLRAVAADLGWDKARLSRLESGQQNITVEDVAALLAIYRITDDRRELLLEAARAVDEPGWWEKTAGMTKESAALADYESEASELISWELALVPGLLQTMDYAAALMDAAFGMAHDEIGPRLGVRRERQKAVAGKPHTAYLGESALRAVVGDRLIMDAQLGSLADRDDVTIRVVPTAAPAHLGMLGGFMLLRFDAAPVVVNVELVQTAVFLDDENLTAPYEQAITQVAGVAMSETESRGLIEQIREELRS